MLWDQGSTLTTSCNRNYLLKGPISTYRHTGGEGCPHRNGTRTQFSPYQGEWKNSQPAAGLGASQCRVGTQTLCERGLSTPLQTKGRRDERGRALQPLINLWVRNKGRGGRLSETRSKCDSCRTVSAELMTPPDMGAQAAGSPSGWGPSQVPQLSKPTLLSGSIFGQEEDFPSLKSSREAGDT